MPAINNEKWSNAIADQLIQLLRIKSIVRACDDVGIRTVTYYNWLQAGEKDPDSPQALYGFNTRAREAVYEYCEHEFQKEDDKLDACGHPITDPVTGKMVKHGLPPAIIFRMKRLNKRRREPEQGLDEHDINLNANVHVDPLEFIRRQKEKIKDDPDCD